MTRRHPWITAIGLAAFFAAMRLFTDVAVPPHLRWWLTAFVAFNASILTSLYWLTIGSRNRSAS